MEYFVGKEILEEFFIDYINICKEFNICMELRFNADETQIKGVDNHAKVAVIKGSRKPIVVEQKEGEHITLLAVINAQSEMFKPLVITPHSSIQNYCHRVSNFFYTSGSENGWITENIFKTYIKKCFVAELNEYRTKNGLQDRWALLILDNHSSHMWLNEEKTFLEENYIKNLFLPAHTTPYLQPLQISL